MRPYRSTTATIVLAAGDGMLLLAHCGPPGKGGGRGGKGHGHNDGPDHS